MNEITEGDFVNLANNLIGTGLINTGKVNYELALDLAKQEIFSFLKFKEKYQHEEKARAHQAYAKAGGIFTWEGAADEKIFELYRNQK